MENRTQYSSSEVRLDEEIEAGAGQETGTTTTAKPLEPPFSFKEQGLDKLEKGSKTRARGPFSSPTLHLETS